MAFWKRAWVRVLVQRRPRCHVASTHPPQPWSLVCMVRTQVPHLAQCSEGAGGADLVQAMPANCAGRGPPAGVGGGPARGRGREPQACETPPPPRCLSPGFGFLSLEVEALLGDVVVWLALWFLSSRSCGGSWRWPLVWGGVFLPLAPCCPAGDLVWVVCYPPPLQLTGSGTRGRGECSPVHRTRVHTRTHWRACPQMGTRGVTRHHVRLTRAAPL